MWTNLIITISCFADAIAGMADQVNTWVLAILKASRFSNLFLSLVLTGSLSTAITILLIGCVMHPIKPGG
jgi:hypothetical protein